MSNTMDDIRKAIDTIDQQIHDLLIKRAEFALQIGAEKRKGNLPMIQPDREASKIRTILARHTGDLPKTMIVRIWREIISAASILQTDMKVAVVAPIANAQEHWNMARDYFGSVIPVQGFANPLSAISALREEDCNFAILPWPEDDVENPWWCHLASEDSARTVRIVVRLPYGNTESAPGNPEYRAVIVSKTAFRDSGADNSFIFVDLDDIVSRARVVDKAKVLGFKPISINSRRIKQVQTRSQHLLEVEGYVADDDPRLPQLLEKLESPEGKCFSLGGYPVLPSLAGRKSAPAKKGLKSK
jgi:chorismate mutase/prephenate dehydratase